MITLRPATIEDAEFLLELKNDPDTRKNSIVTDSKIKLEDHMKWLEKRLEKPGMNIILLDDEPAGDLRFDYGKETELSVRIKKEFRGQKLATRAISLTLGKLIAYIVEGNVASMRAFICNGFKPVKYIKGERVNYYKFVN